MTEAWEVEVRRTWLGEPRRCAKMQKSVAALLAKAGGKSPFPTFDQVNENILEFGQDGHWFWCTTILALCGELLLCAETGGVFTETFTKHRPEYLDASNTIRHLRNAACHPAHVSPKNAGEPHVLRLAAHLEARGQANRGQVLGLRKDPSTLCDRWVAETALRALNLVGGAFQEQFR